MKITILISITILLCLIYSCSHKKSGGSDIAPPDIVRQKTMADTLLSQALAFVYRPGSEKSDMDSAMMLTGMAETINNKLHDTVTQGRIYFVYSNALREQNDTARGRPYIDQAIEILKQTSAHELLGEAYMEKSSYYSDFTSEYSLTTKESCFVKAAPQFDLAGSKEKQADALKNMGDMRMIFADLDQAMIDLKKALAIYTSIHYKKLQGIYDLLGYISIAIGDCPTAVKYGLLAVKTANSENDTTMQMCTINNRLALAYFNLHDDAHAEQYWSKAVGLALKYQDRTAVYGMMPNYSQSMLNQQKWEETIRFLKNVEIKLKPATRSDSIRLFASYTNACLGGAKYDDAKKYADKSITILQTCTAQQFYIEPAYRYLIHYFMALGQYKMADKYVGEYLNFSTAQGYAMGLSMSHRLKSQIDSALGDYKGALSNYVAYKHITDSLQEHSQKLQIAQLQIQYETDKKDQDLLFKQKDIELLTNQSQLKDATLKKATLTRNLIIIAGIFLLTIAYLGYRVKQQHNSKLEAQQKEINKQNELLKGLLAEQKKLVTEKEWLVKEIHHRVKNNLQIVISLLNAQSEYLDSQSAIDAIRESKERMHAIALIHQKLYQPDHGTEICMKSYIQEMVAYLKNSFTDVGTIDFALDIDDIDMDVSQAVPLGLIINEAITNAIKYAFTQGSEGRIKVSLLKTQDNRIQMKIADNGKGLPVNFDVEKNNSLGIQLIHLFAEQLDGELAFHNENGLEISLTFKSSEKDIA